MARAGRGGSCTQTEVRIAVVGKYMKHRDAYKSVYESLDHAGIAIELG